MFLDQKAVFDCVHAAHVATVEVSFFRAGAYALDEGNCFGNFHVAWSD